MVSFRLHLTVLLMVCSLRLNKCQNQSTTVSPSSTSSTSSTTTISNLTTTISNLTTVTAASSTTTLSTTSSTSTTASPSTSSSSAPNRTTTAAANTLVAKSKNATDPLDSNDLSTAASGRGRTKARSVEGFNEHFALCKRGSSDFDKCIRDALNRVRKFIQPGVPELNIPSFDPIYAKEVILKRGGPSFGYKLKLKNVRESGWRMSEVTKFKSNLKLNTVQLTQYFPDKYLEGEYEFDSLILSPSSNKGHFNLSLYELNQTTTLSKPRNSKSIKVNVDVQEIGDMKLHISHLLRGRTRMENILDRMINSPAWRPGFVIMRPFVNELVSTAFTEIYNRVFNDYNFDEILPPS